MLLQHLAGLHLVRLLVVKGEMSIVHRAPGQVQGDGEKCKGGDVGEDRAKGLAVLREEDHVVGMGHPAPEINHRPHRDPRLRRGPVLVADRQVSHPVLLGVDPRREQTGLSLNQQHPNIAKIVRQPKLATFFWPCAIIKQ